MFLTGYPLLLDTQHHTTTFSILLYIYGHDCAGLLKNGKRMDG